MIHIRPEKALPSEGKDAPRKEYDDHAEHRYEEGQKVGVG